MYKIDDLKKYKYFENADVNFVLDSLTGVVSRQYILEFAKSLVNNNTPFTMVMIDLDNFKSINDNYGHHVGDLCLQKTADGIQKIVGDDGLVGRFGGDEFIVIYLKSTEYNTIHDFFDNFYYNEGPLRRVLMIENNKIFVTATVGSASFPTNALDYDDLFLKMDKALYRGKSKGRNCYIIYVHEKHKDIIVKEREGKSLIEKLERIESICNETNIELVRTNLVDYLYRILHPYNVIYVNDDNYIQVGNKTQYYHYDQYDSYNIIKNILGDHNYIAASDMLETISLHPETADFIEENKILAFVITKVANHGFFVVIENSISRMWQDSDLVLLYFAANQLNHRLDENQK